MSRGVRGELIYKDDEDYELFLQIVEVCKKEIEFKVHSYCLMSNHFHMQIETADVSISEIMEKMLKMYANNFNSKYNYRGHVFQGRYASKLIEDPVYFLETGKILTPSEKSMRKKNQKGRIKIEKETKIESDFVCSEVHRAFFKEQIGRNFSFNVTFQKWLKANAGKTYEEAIKAYDEILAEKKKTKTTIDKQFEYNTYIRDFFEDNKGASLQEAIQCWKYKKQLQGHNRYEKADLVALEKINPQS